ncbi:OsmC family protein [Prochlorococcus sp. MIT 0916]|uniref:OsmC family protein n=1 Tax=Prochlorococcus sp. MIT 0916 TaxID=3082521 RepID=UPI0039B5BB7D
MHTEAKHSISGSVIHTDAPKDHDGEGKDFAPTDLLASSLGTCVITIMGIEARRREWELGKIVIDVYKSMTSEGPRKIKTLELEIFMPSELDTEKYKILQRIAEDCPVKLSLERSVDIKLNWHQTKI